MPPSSQASGKIEASATYSNIWQQNCTREWRNVPPAGGSFSVRTTFDWEASMAHVLCRGLTFSGPIVVIDWCTTVCVAACVKRALRRDKPSYCLAALMLAGALR